MNEANVYISDVAITPSYITVGSKYVISVEIQNKDILLAIDSKTILLGTSNTAIKVKENK